MAPAIGGVRYPIFGTPLPVVMQIQGKGYIPFVVETCIRYLWTRAGEMGVFRAAECPESERLQAVFDAGENPDLEAAAVDPIVVGHLLMAFFSRLPDPLLTLDLYDALLQTQGIADPNVRVPALRRLCDRLPDCHHALLEALVAFLAHAAAQKDGPNTTADIAEIFAPILLRSSSSAASDEIDKERRDASTRVVLDLLTHYDGVLGVLMLGRFDERYTIEKFLGRGRFATVSVCRDIVTAERCAVKVVSKVALNEKEISNVRSEISILKRVRHPNVIALRAVAETHDELFLVTELAEGGELFDEIVDRESFQENDASFIVHQLCSALEFLHSMNVVHRGG